MSIRVLVLTTLVALSGSVAYWLGSERDEESGQIQSQAWMKGFSEQASAINSVTISNPQGVIFKASQQNGEWMANHLDTMQSFPVDRQALGELVGALRNAQVLEPKTANPDNYTRLGLEALDVPDAQSVLLELATGKQKWSLIVGDSASSGLGQYVREQGRAVSYLIDTTLSLPRSSIDWLENEVLPFSDQDIEKVVVAFNRQPEMTLTRSEGDVAEPWIWEQQPRDSSLAFPGVIAQTIGQMTPLQFTDVAPYVQHQWEQQVLIGDIVFTLGDGSEIFAYMTEADDEGLHKIWFSTPDSPHWVSDWVFTLNEYQASVFQITSEQLLQPEG
ncbi:DUF4340 domain-containing protein [Alteromonas antoniana]|uniref:DUF4340 domain-containing protein n=1 Tax=Alteromonas antoniana TaxID=2803813 RepID=UPI001C456C5C|nr:DUF4340 domain-containing protein [Alteromonas antoniana]